MPKTLDDEFIEACGLEYGFDMRAFDRFLEGEWLGEEGRKAREMLLEERADAFAAWQAQHGEWLVARLEALYRAGAYNTYRRSAIEAHSKQKESATKKQILIDRLKKRDLK